MNDLIIPANGEVVPRGWAEEYLLPKLWDVDDTEFLWESVGPEIQKLIAEHKAKGHDIRELQAGKCFLEIRIGELLGPGERGGDQSKSVMTDLSAKERHNRSQLTYALRRLAWWDDAAVVKIALDGVRQGKRSRGSLTRYIEETIQLEREPTHTKPEVREGDFSEVLEEIPDGTIDLILTDPPYPAEFLDEWTKLAKFAARKLTPGGSLLAYSGQGNLPECLARLSEHLRYWWIISLAHEHGSQNLPGKFVTIGWKPILWYVRDKRRDTNYVADRLSGSSPRKTMHEWGQGRDELKSLIESLTAPGNLIVDPFAGSGTVGEAALALGRQFIGAELNV